MVLCEKPTERRDGKASHAVAGQHVQRRVLQQRQTNPYLGPENQSGLIFRGADTKENHESRCSALLRNQATYGGVQNQTSVSNVKYSILKNLAAAFFGVKCDELASKQN